MPGIPVRVHPAEVPVTARAGFILSPDHPLRDEPCPVCDLPFLDERVSLVLLGREPDAGWRAAAAAVHTRCTGTGGGTGTFEFFKLHQAGEQDVARRTAAAHVFLDALDEAGVLVDAVLPDGTHRYYSTHCRHGRHDACDATTLNDGPRQPGQCKTCAAPCRCRHHNQGDPTDAAH